jgi:3-deoxy-7-phosphoheptulonate synthase
LPWIGERTNKRPPAGQVNPHVELLSGIENTVGVKIGPSSDAEHIKWLAEKLNPNSKPGKLVFMLRLGDDTQAMHRVLGGIQQFAPDSFGVFDIHGSTETDQNGLKIRSVERIVAHIKKLKGLSLKYDVKLRGLHLETSGEPNTRQSVDYNGQTPEEKPVVDPLLNTRQLSATVRDTAAVLAR